VSRITRYGKGACRIAARTARRCTQPAALLAGFVGAVLALVPPIAGPTASGVDLLPYTPLSAHQVYGYRLALTRFLRNPSARQWFGAAERALREPETVTLPYAATGRFSAADDAALGYGFDVHDGRRVRIELGLDANEQRELFVDVYRVAGARLERVASGRAASPGVSAASAPVALELAVPEAGRYQLRVQPQLTTAGAYSVRIAAAPLLAFPVKGMDTRAIQSGFGVERDGGRRAHRGVDIFAPRGTTALAAADGWVMRVETTKVGGNVVWIQPTFDNMRLYYAHLDTQLVVPGQFVRAGEPIGTVGNTGNAITTPPHLHFGVYLRQRGGARDPSVFLR
jgi:murein DD-endopeptidase MepM/ murein hydrolase activator NlpD